VAKKATSQGELSANTRVAALIGKEVFLQAECTAQLKALLEKAHGEVAVFRFDGLSTPLADVLDECRTFGLMASYKLVIVDNADQVIKEDNRPLIERYVASPCESATLVLRTTNWHAGKLDEMIAKVGAIVRCEAKTHADAAAWAVANCLRRHKATIEPKAAELLVNRIGTDMGRLDTELEKLAVSATSEDGRPPVITMKQVADLVGLTREEEVWVVHDSLLSGHAPTAMGHVHLILDNARKDANIPLAYACMDLARKLNGAAQGLKLGMNPWQLGGKLKLWPESRKEAILSHARRVPPARLANLLHAAVLVDVKQKTGGGDPDRMLEILALRFARTLGR
jgi:DNA polymerase III delta subunit